MSATSLISSRGRGEEILLMEVNLLLWGCPRIEFTPFKKAGNAFVSLLVLLVYMGGVDCLLSGYPNACLSSVPKNIKDESL